MPRLTHVLPLAALAVTASCTVDDRPAQRLTPTEASRSTTLADGAGLQIIRTPRAASAPAAASVAAAPPVALAGIVGVGAGNQFSCALRNDGQVFCWGANAAGQFGNGSLAGSRTPMETAGPQRFVALSVGDLNVCGLEATGAAFCWGDNTNGQLGNGVTGGSALVPTAVSGGHQFVALEIGLRSICGIATDGVTYCWGNNQFGQLGIGVTGADVNVPAAVVNSASLGFTQVSPGFFTTCARRAAGEVYCWGSGGARFGNGTTAPSSNVPVPAANGLTVAHLDMGASYGCAITPIGRAGCWGQGIGVNSGEFGNGSFASPVATPTPIVGTLRYASIDANDNNSIIASTCGLLRTGQAWCWGSNQFGQLGAASSATCTFGITSYDCSATPLPVGGGRSYAALAVGITHVCAVHANGNVFCWGDNRSGQLGDNTLAPSMTPVQVVRLGQNGRDGYVAVTPLAPTVIFREGTVQLQGQLLNEDGTPAAVQPSLAWRSSDPAIASVNQQGLVTGHANGAVVVSVRTQAGQFGHAPVTVNILDPVVAFQRAWSGGNGFHGTSDGLVVWGGLLADEWIHSGTFPTRSEVDLRAVSAGNAQLGQLFSALQLARRALEHEEGRLLAVSPTDPAIGQMRALSGYIYLGLAENFCSGVPLDDPDTGLSTNDLFTMAQARFAQALAGPVAAPFDLLSQAGTARALVGIGDANGASAAAALVPAGFSYATTHSSAVGFENTVYSLNALQRRLTIPDAEGGNGVPWRSANDPRVPWTPGGGPGFDATTPWFVSLKYGTVSDNIVIASANEARLIEAESRLRLGDVAGFVAALNALRASVGLPVVLDPGSPQGRENLLFDERANWLYATGTRLGDLRRRIRLYGSSQASVLPAGPYHKFGGSYGSDANLPVPLSARGSSYTGCTDRTS